MRTTQNPNFPICRPCFSGVVNMIFHQHSRLGTQAVGAASRSGLRTRPQKSQHGSRRAPCTPPSLFFFGIFSLLNGKTTRIETGGVFFFYCSIGLSLHCVRPQYVEATRRDTQRAVTCHLDGLSVWVHIVVPPSRKQVKRVRQKIRFRDSILRPPVRAARIVPLT